MVFWWNAKQRMTKMMMAKKDKCEIKLERERLDVPSESNI